MTAFIMICLIVEEIVKDRYMYGDSLGPLTNNKHAFNISPTSELNTFPARNRTNRSKEKHT